jgi:hypothetical protein
MSNNVEPDSVYGYGSGCAELDVRCVAPMRFRTVRIKNCEHSSLR